MKYYTQEEYDELRSSLRIKTVKFIKAVQIVIEDMEMLNTKILDNGMGYELFDVGSEKMLLKYLKDTLHEIDNSPRSKMILRSAAKVCELIKERYEETK